MKKNEERGGLDFRRLFALGRDQASPEDIDEAIRAGVKVSGTNLWILMFAIMIASVGLNVNSTAVIIGAMLISPLMAPFIAAGYGAAIFDFALIRKALRTLAIFVAISMVTATLYFLVTPLREAQSELLARTSPNIWDVMIAFFGDAAGMVGLTRRERTTVIPGVAIATALMPPICTASYGIATGQPKFLFGAFYLFTINAVFIALATLLIARVLRLPQHHFPNEAARLRGRLLISGLVAVTLAPSVYLAAQLVREHFFVVEANRFVDGAAAAEREAFIASREIDPSARRIALGVVGGDGAALRTRLEDRMAGFALEGARLELRVAGSVPRPEAGLSRTQAAQQALQLERLRALEAELSGLRAREAEQAKLAAEIRAQFPALTAVSVARGESPAPDGKALPRMVVLLEGSAGFPSAELGRLERWLAVRLPEAEVKLVYQRLRRS